MNARTAGELAALELGPETGALYLASVNGGLVAAPHLIEGIATDGESVTITIWISDRMADLVIDADVRLTYYIEEPA